MYDRKIKVWSGEFPDPDDFSFKDFSRVKTLRLMREARDLLTKAITRGGYTSSDVDGYAFRIISDDRVQLEIIGFDFEYYSRVFDSDQINDELEKNAEYEIGIENRDGIGFANWNSGDRVTAAQQVGFFAFLKDKGILDLTKC